MIGILLDDLTSAQTAARILDFKTKLSQAGFSFGKVFPVILTDNGGEFSDVFSFKLDLLGNTEARLFFCDPGCSWQKPHVEKNHTILRDILPKGSSFDNLTQDSLNIALSHVNSVKHLSLGGKTPLEVFAFTHGKDLVDLLGLSLIPPSQVVQSPKLLQHLI